MEKIKYHKQEHDFIERPSRLAESDGSFYQPSRRTSSVTEPATKEQLRLLDKLGIWPKWRATRYEAQEMIDCHQFILNSVNHRHW